FSPFWLVRPAAPLLERNRIAPLESDFEPSVRALVVASDCQSHSCALAALLIVWGPVAAAIWSSRVPPLQPVQLVTVSAPALVSLATLAPPATWKLKKSPVNAA